jgi:hypothetical protein
MKDDKRAGGGQPATAAHSLPTRILGSLRDALNAASRDDRSGEITVGTPTEILPKTPSPEKSAPSPARPPEAPAARQVSAADALREAKAPAAGPQTLDAGEPTTRVIRAAPGAKPAASPAAMDDTGKTQAVRGKPKLTRTAFHQDPVVGWLVVIGGPGLGAYRPIFEGNNALGRAKSQRIPIDFGDDALSSEEQAWIRYDSSDRSFLFVPNLSKTNIVSVNDKKPTGAVKLEPMDVITVGRTQLAFVPFCGDEFDWSELAELKE